MVSEHIKVVTVQFADVEVPDEMPTIDVVLGEVANEFLETPKENIANSIIKTFDKRLLCGFYKFVWNKLTIFLKESLPKTEKDPESSHWVQMGKNGMRFSVAQSILKHVKTRCHLFRMLTL